MKKALKDLFGSKRALSTMAGLLVAGLAKVGLDLSDEIALGLMALVGMFVLSQGSADKSKEAVKLELAAYEKEAK